MIPTNQYSFRDRESIIDYGGEVNERDVVGLIISKEGEIEFIHNGRLLGLAGSSKYLNGSDTTVEISLSNGAKIDLLPYGGVDD